jgi:hypothetical protein
MINYSLIFLTAFPGEFIPIFFVGVIIIYSLLFYFNLHDDKEKPRYSKWKAFIISITSSVIGVISFGYFVNIIVKYDLFPKINFMIILGIFIILALVFPLLWYMTIKKLFKRDN